MDECADTLTGTGDARNHSAPQSLKIRLDEPMRAGKDSSVLSGWLPWCLALGLTGTLAGCQTTGPGHPSDYSASHSPASHSGTGIQDDGFGCTAGPCVPPTASSDHWPDTGSGPARCGDCRDPLCADRQCGRCGCQTAATGSGGSTCLQCRYDVPRELQKVSLPDYVVEPPDILLIEVTNSLRPPDAPLRAGELVEVRVANTLPIDQFDDGVSQDFKSIDGTFRVQTDGTLHFGPEYGSVPVRGLSIAEAQRLVELHLKKTLRQPRVLMRAVTDDARQHVGGEHLVRPDGTVALGVYGSVFVAGLSLTDARLAIEDHLSKHLHAPEVSLDVLAYNSKVYYIVTDGGGAGEQVFRFPVTGNETVLDALSQINGLPSVASKKHIWIARPAPANVGYQQVLDVDWNGIVQGAETATNYQILPGDRIYVQADELITFDTAVAKLTAPLERILGFVLLGHGTVRAIQFGHRFTGGGGGTP